MPQITKLIPDRQLRIRELLEQKLPGAKTHAVTTLRSYHYDWRSFTAWCTRTQIQSLPATSKTVSSYLLDLIASGRKIATAVRRATGIQYRHVEQGYDSPVTEEIWTLLTNAQRILRQEPDQKRAISLEQVRRISRDLAREGTYKALRDRAVIVTGFTSALRRSNLAELRLADIEFMSQGVILRIHHEKNDQEGKGRYIGLPRGRHCDTCPVHCLRDWLRIRGKEPGPLFCYALRRDRSRHFAGQVIGMIVKDAVKRIGLDPREYAGHSLRAGFVTAAAEAGAGELLIAAQTGHRNMKVLREYFRRTDLFRSNACSLLGL